MSAHDPVKDVISLIMASTNKIEYLESADGIPVRQEVSDPEVIYYMTRSVNNSRFNNFVFHFKQFEGMGDQCVHSMSIERARVIKEGIESLCASFKRSVDAKSSESVFDKNNRQKTFIDVLSSSKEERIVTVNSKDSKTIKEAIFGRHEQE